MADETRDDQTTPTTGPLGVVGGTTHNGPPGGTKNSRPPTLEQTARTRFRLGLDGFDEIDRRMLTILAEKPGIKDRELAEAVGLSRETTNRRKNRPGFREALRELALGPIEVFQKNQIRAARRLGELINAKDEMVAIRACLAHLMPLWREMHAKGGSEAETFGRFLEDAYNAREQRKTPTTSTEPATTTRHAARA